MKLATVLSLLVVSSCAFADQTIYSSKFENGWQNWSWAKLTMGKTFDVKADKAWVAAYFHHDPQPSKFKSFTFRVNGSGGEKIQLRATVNKQPLKEAFLPALKPGWQTVTVTFKQLGLTGQPFDGIWIQAQKIESFKLADVTLKS